MWIFDALQSINIFLGLKIIIIIIIIDNHGSFFLIRYKIFRIDKLY